jgi:hypothetical protein
MSDINTARSGAQTAALASLATLASLAARAPGAFAVMGRIARRAVVLVPVAIGASGCLTTQGTSQGATSGALATGLSAARTGADLALTPPTMVKDAAVGVGLGVSEVAKDETTDTLTKGSVIIEEGGALVWRTGIRTLTGPVIGAFRSFWDSVNTSVDDASKTLDKVTGAVTSSGKDIRSGK